MEYDEIVDMVVDELTERGFQQQRKEDEQVDQLIKRRIELKEQVRSCTAGLDENAKKALEDYHEIIEEVYGFQVKYIYLQGTKDCVRLLKSLEVI